MDPGTSQSRSLLLLCWRCPLQHHMSANHTHPRARAHTHTRLNTQSKADSKTERTKKKKKIGLDFFFFFFLPIRPRYSCAGLVGLPPRHFLFCRPCTIVQATRRQRYQLRKTILTWLRLRPAGYIPPITNLGRAAINWNRSGAFRQEVIFPKSPRLESPQMLF